MSTIRSLQKQAATKKWLSNPEVRNIQNEKARQRSARKKEEFQLVDEDETTYFAPEDIPDTHPGSPDPPPRFLRQRIEQGLASEANAPCELSHNIRSLRLEVVNWSFGWKPESGWDSRFHDELLRARARGGRKGVDEFLTECAAHASEGRDLLKDLKFVASGSCNSTKGEVVDLFLQGYEMVMEVACEVKFFELKLEQYAPQSSMSKISDIRQYSDI